MDRKPGCYNARERALQKEHSRDADSIALVKGEMSRDQLRRRNGLFSGLDIERSSIICTDAFE